MTYPFNEDRAIEDALGDAQAKNAALILAAMADSHLEVKRLADEQKRTADILRVIASILCDALEITTDGRREFEKEIDRCKSEVAG
jgi:hypothetical protein